MDYQGYGKVDHEGQVEITSRVHVFGWQLVVAFSTPPNLLGVSPLRG